MSSIYVTLEMSRDEAFDRMAEWEERADRLQEEVAILRDRIKDVKSQLAATAEGGGDACMTRTEPTAKPDQSQAKQVIQPLPKESRRPRGENLAAIVSFLRERGTQCPATVIHVKTGIALSSVQAVLKRNPEVFQREESGLWSLRTK